ncbi:hypothetical protein GCM10022289_18320 [Pedobacter jeongneungensis]|uniref:Uncharacterized protein n=1 Tax=Pedobacter jeongneungensis TaxID=947309 RepID=A0ABP8BBM9_9SPHI
MGLIEIDMWANLLKRYFSLETSTEFLNLADTQLSSIFERETGIKIQHKNRLRWASDEGIVLQSAILMRSKETSEILRFAGGRPQLFSRISSKLVLQHRYLDVNICWTTKSGIIYTLGSTSIDPADIEFWFEGLDIEKCQRYNNPDLANLIVWPDLFVEELQNKLDVNMSVPFATCMNAQLTPIFENTSGLKVKNLVVLLIDKDRPFQHEKAETSKISIALGVYDHVNSIDILWKSKSGRIYDIADEDINCNDIEFSFGNLNIVEYHKQANPYGNQLPFKLKDLSYKLTVNRIQLECYITLTVKASEAKNADQYASGMENFIAAYNEKALKSKNSGVIHNCNYSIKENTIDFHIDLGSVGADFFKKLFKYLSELNVFEEVTVD